jgi:hypothetical protein
MHRRRKFLRLTNHSGCPNFSKLSKLVIMKLRKINILTAVAFTAAVMFTACSKDDGAIPKRVQIEEVPAVTTLIDGGVGAANLVKDDSATFVGKFKMDLFFPGAKPPDKIDVVVRKNASKDKVKVFKTGVTSLPAEFTFTAKEVCDLFGEPLVVGDTYDFAPDIYVGTKKYETFPQTGEGFGQSHSGMNGLGYYAWVRWTVK